MIVTYRNKYMNTKNMIEDKQLDLNRPLLSVRRFSSTTASFKVDDQKRKADKSLTKLPSLPAYKSELKSGPMRNPGTVPFVWEQSPGRPKDERKSQTHARELPLIAPKLPPGRASNIKQQDPDKGPKDTIAAQSQAVLSSSPEVSNLEKENAYNYKGSKEVIEEQSSSSSEDDDRAYVDARDALSRSESFFMNCSITGVSGLDGPDIKSSGTSTTDSQTRDFMMDRFLPAARAMASETPQSAARKQLVVREQPRHTNKVAERVKQQRPLNQYRPNVLPYYVPEIGMEESEDETNDYNGFEDFSTKVCGLLPRFCLLNPVPGMRIRPQLSVSSVCRVRAKPPYSGSCNETKDKTMDAVCDQRSVDGQNTSKPQVGLPGLDMPTHKSGHSQPVTPNEKGFVGTPEKTKNPMESGIDFQRKGRNNFLKLLANENTEGELDSESPVAEKTLHVDSVYSISSPRENSSDIKEFIDNRETDILIPERIINIDKTPSDSSLQSIKNLSVVNEKETVHPEILKCRDSSLIPCHERSTHEMKLDLSKDMRRDGDLICGPITNVTDKENFCLESKWWGKSSSQENSHGFTKGSTTLMSLKIVDEEKIHIESQKNLGVTVGESLCAWSPDTLKNSTIANDRKIYLKSQPPIKSGVQRSSHGPVQRSNNKAGNNQNIDLEKGQLLNVGRQQSSDGSYLHMPLALPPPKSPSESWLKRTLPAVSSKSSSSSMSSLAPSSYASNCDSKTSSLDPKWEMIVKISNTRHRHLQFSEEHLTSIPEA